MILLFTLQPRRHKNKLRGGPFPVPSTKVLGYSLPVPPGRKSLQPGRKHLQGPGGGAGVGLNQGEGRGAGAGAEVGIGDEGVEGG